MISNVLKIGDRIELMRITDDNTPQKVYVSQVLDMLDNYKLNIAVPIESGHLVPLEVGGKFDLRFLTSQGLYVCRAIITNRFKQNNLYFLAINIVSDLKKDQRRQYFRLDKIIDMKYHIILAQELAILEILEKRDYKDDREKRILEGKLREVSGDEIKGTISNISGGGIKFSSGMMHEKDMLLKVGFILDENDSTSRVIQKVKLVSTDSVPNKGMMFEHRAEFVDINREARERIVRYVFNEERKQRKRESGTV